jgi:hypothetical protein
LRVRIQNLFLFFGEETIISFLISISYEREESQRKVFIPSAPRVFARSQRRRGNLTKYQRKCSGIAGGCCGIPPNLVTPYQVNHLIIKSS